MSRLQTLLLPAPVVQEPKPGRGWLIAIVALVLLAAGAAFAETPQQALQALQATKPGSEAHKQAAQRYCQAEKGDKAVALWTSEGELVCRVITVEVRR